MDPYATLGIDRSASDAEIRSAYRKLAKKYHPDLNPGNREAEEKFKAIGRANEILGDKEKRARFDRGEIDADGNERGFAGGFGGGQSRGHAGGGFGGFGGGNPFGAGGVNPGDLEDLISAFGGGQGFGGFGGFGAGDRHARQPRSRRGQDMRAEMTIPFVQAVLGGRQEIRLDGQPVAVTIPPGIVDGTVMRLRGRGGKGYSATGGSPAPDGDLLLTIHVENDLHYVREGRNLRSTRDIDLQTAVLGGKIEVPTPKGPVMVNVKPHSDTGTALRLAGRGVAAHKSQPAGDLFVTLRVRLGEKDPELEAFFRKRAEKDSQDA